MEAKYKTKRQWLSPGNVKDSHVFPWYLARPLILVFLPGMLFAQPDTSAIVRQLDGLVSIESHRAWWAELYRVDQAYRGHLTVDSLDNINLVKVAMYVNRFGLPDKNLIGRPANAAWLVWIHSKYPRATAWAFPIVLEQYRQREISEFSLRDYYLRSLYLRRFPDEGYRTRPLGEIFHDLELNLARTIDIVTLLSLLEEEETFLRQPFDVVGTWRAAATKDTLSLDGKPLALSFQEDPIRIFRDTSGQAWLHRLYADGSHYPQPLIQDNPAILVYRLFPEGGPVYTVLANGDLEETADGQVRIFARQH